MATHRNICDRRAVRAGICRQREQKPREGSSETPAQSPPPDFALSERDVRRKRPPVLSFLLKLDTLRKVVRVSTLLIARLLRRLPGDPHGAVAEGRHPHRRLDRPQPGGADRRAVRLRLPADRAAVRALGAVLRARRAPRPVADRLLARAGRVRRADLRDRQRQPVQLVLHLLRLAVLRRHLRLAAAPQLREGDRRAAARGRLPAPRGARRHRPAHRGRRPRAARRRPSDREGRRLHLADAAAQQRAAVARHARRARAGHPPPPHRRGDHRRPRLPAAAGGRARRRRACQRRARADRAVDDGAARAPRRVRARRGGAAVRAQAAGLRGLRLLRQAHVRPRHLVGCCCSC